MALTPEIIKANEALSGLSEEQLSAIAALSLNEEAAATAAKVEKIHENYGKALLGASGVEKIEGEKAGEYLKRVMAGYKAQPPEPPADTTGGESDEALAQQLKDAKSQLAQLQAQHDADKAAWGEEKEGLNSKITGIRVDAEFDKAASALKFKSAYPESIQQVLLKNAREGILAQHTAEWVDDVMVFRDSKGEVLRNKNNALHPYTAQELLSEQLKEVLDQGRRAAGAGTAAPGRKSQGEVVDIAGAKSQIEADAAITKYLMQRGETRGSASFAEKQSKLREDNGVAKLPLR